MQRANPSSFIGLFIAILAVSTAALFIRMAQTGAPSLVVALLRLGFAALILAPLALFTRRGEISKLKKNQVLLLASSGALLALHFWAWIASLELTSVTSSVVLVTTSPLWTALLSPIFLKEKITRSQVIGLGLAMLGGITVGTANTCAFTGNSIKCTPLLDMTSGGSALLGNLLALAGAVLVAGYFLIGRRLRKDISLITYTFLVYGFAAVLLLLAVLASGLPLLSYPIEIYGWGLLLALFPQIIGHSLLNWSLKYLPASYVSIAVLGEPVGSSILAMVFLREPPTGMEIAGGVLILVGILISSHMQGENRVLQAEEIQI
jgi:drug/metabolite transporter (DMT)-like permease